MSVKSQSGFVLCISNCPCTLCGMLMISHMDDGVVGEVLELIKEEFGKDVSPSHAERHMPIWACKLTSAKKEE
jgi:hypothetical protein